MKTTKFFSICLLLIATAMFSACKDDDNEPTTIDIVGSWTYETAALKSLTFTTPEMEKLVKPEVEARERELVEGIDDIFGGKIFEFTKDGQANTCDPIGGDSEHNSYTLLGNRLTLTEDGDDYFFTATVQGNKLYLDCDAVENYPGLLPLGVKTYVVRLTFVKNGSWNTENPEKPVPIDPAGKYCWEVTLTSFDETFEQCDLTETELQEMLCQSGLDYTYKRK